MRLLLVLLIIVVSIGQFQADEECTDSELIYHDRIFSIDIHPDQPQLAILSQSGAFIYSIPELNLLHTVECYHFPFSAFIIDWSPDGSQLAIYNDTHTGIKVYDSDTFILDKTLYVENDDSGVVGSEVDSMAWSPSGQYIAIGSPLENFSFRVWDVHTEEIVFADKDLINGDYWNINPQGIQWSGDSRYIAVANSIYGQITIVDFIEQETAQILGSLDEEDIGHLGWNGNFLATSGYQNILRIWDTETWEEQQLPEISAFSLDWNPSSNLIAIAEFPMKLAGKTEGDILIFDMETEEITFSFGNTNNWIQSIQWSANGQYLVTLESEILESHIIVWEVKSGEITSELERIASR